MNLKNNIEEYDFKNGIRGKYAKYYKDGVNIMRFKNDTIKFINIKNLER